MCFRCYVAIDQKHTWFASAIATASALTGRSDKWWLYFFTHASNTFITDIRLWHSAPHSQTAASLLAAAAT
jgi:hypothetical protein